MDNIDKSKFKCFKIKLDPEDESLKQEKEKSS